MSETGMTTASSFASIRVLSIVASLGSWRLLLVALDDVLRADVGLVGILAELAQRPTLAQQVPALVELDLDRVQSVLIGVRQHFLAVERVLLLHERFDVMANRQVNLFLVHVESSY